MPIHCFETRLRSCSCLRIGRSRNRTTSNHRHERAMNLPFARRGRSPRGQTSKEGALVPAQHTSSRLAVRLPAFRPRVFYNPQGRYLRCLVRDKLIRATPEETVRQRVLAWLTREKRLAKGQLKLEDNLSYANRSRGRPDISVYDDSGKCRLIVEVKRSEDVAGYDALSQAQRYARRLAVTEVWVTNGDRHSFARRTPSGAWREVRGSRILRAESLGRLKASQIPNPKNKKGVGRYLRLFPEFRALEREKLECLLTLRKLLQQPGHF